MPDLEHARPSTIRNAAWRTAYRIGFPLARLRWRVRRQRHEGALVAVHVGPALLLVRSSYRIAWNFPGRHYPARRDTRNGGAARTGRGDRPRGVPTASRGHRLRHLGRAHRPSAFFELRLEQLPELRLDNREIIGARLVSAAELRGMALTGPVTAYLGRMPPPGGNP